MKLILMVVALSQLAFPASQEESSASQYLASAQKSLSGGLDAEASVSAEKGWWLALKAGPSAPRFLQAVFDTSVVFHALGRELRAEAIFQEAKAACSTPALEPIKLRLDYMQADDLMRHREYVKAEVVLREGL